MENNQEVLKTFRSGRIYLAMAIGLLVTFFLLYRSLSEIRYVEAEPGFATHRWVDANHNGEVDVAVMAEFVPDPQGSFRKESAADMIGSLQWSGHSMLWLLLALVCMFGRDLAYMWRIRVLTHHELSWKRSFHVIMLWEFASALTPGVVGGSTVAMFILNREKISLGRSTAIVVITAMMDNLFYVLMIPLVFLFISSEHLFPEHDVTQRGVEVVFWIGFLVILLVCLLLFLSIFKFPGLVKSFLGFIFRLPFLRKWRDQALQTGEEVIVASNEFRKEKAGFWLRSFGATLLSWTSRYLVINCILAAFITLGWFDHLFILGKQLVLWLFMLISPTPGASGVAEYAFGELMSSFSHSAFLLAALALIWRLISYFPYLIIGAWIFPRWLRRGSVKRGAKSSQSGNATF